MIATARLCLWLLVAGSGPLVAQPAGPAAAAHRPSAAEITAVMASVRGYLERSFPDGVHPYAVEPLVARGADASAAAELPTAAAESDPKAVLRQLAAGPRAVFGPLDYTTGVIYSGLLQASAATGDPSFARVAARQLDLLGRMLAIAASGQGPAAPMRAALAPAALDDCGAMTAALLRARRAQLLPANPAFASLLGRWTDFITARQFRLPDGAFARQRPQPISVWADDLYMGGEPLVELGRLDDAARDVLQTAQRLFRPDRGLFAHGWSEDAPGVPDFFWGRANGWATLTLCDLLDALPANHPARPRLLELLRQQLQSVASLQSGEGRWHQLVDRTDSYLETSCSAMFVYGLAHAINAGWIVAPTYGPIAQAGWQAVAAQVNAQGQVDQSCIGTTYAGDAVYYYHRPANVNAAHGYGPVLLAGAEMIKLEGNPRLRVDFKNQAFHFVPAP